MIKFNVSGSNTYVSDIDNKNIHDILPLGTYNVEFDNQREILFRI